MIWIGNHFPKAYYEKPCIDGRMQSSARIQGFFPSEKQKAILLLPVMDFQNFVFTKEERQAPDARESDYCINDSAQNSTLATADPCDDIKLEQPNAAPVDGTDHNKDQRNSIQHFFNSFNGFNDSMDGNEKNMRVSNRKFRIMNCKLRESRNQFYLFYEK